jgi:hypothetical protein
MGGRRVARVVQSANGFLVSVNLHDGGDVHLQVISDGLRITRHISDKRAGKVVRQQVHVDEVAVLKRLYRKMKRHILPCRRNPVAYFPTARAKEEMGSSSPPTRVGRSSVVNVEDLAGKGIPADLHNPAMWKRIRVRDLLKESGEVWAVWKRGGFPYYVRPVGRNRVIELSEVELVELYSDLYSKLLGVDPFLEYIGPLIGPKPNQSST